jgi:hypothetical protein
MTSCAVSRRVQPPPDKPFVTHNLGRAEKIGQIFWLNPKPKMDKIEGLKNTLKIYL